MIREACQSNFRIRRSFQSSCLTIEEGALHRLDLAIQDILLGATGTNLAALQDGQTITETEDDQRLRMDLEIDPDLLTMGTAVKEEAEDMAMEIEMVEIKDARTKDMIQGTEGGRLLEEEREEEAGDLGRIQLVIAKEKEEVTVIDMEPKMRCVVSSLSLSVSQSF